MAHKAASNMVIIGHNGPPCPRCGKRTQERRHRKVTAKELARPFYYAKWFYCENGRCKTTMIMPDEHKVWNGAAGGVVTEPAVHRDVALDVLAEMGTGDGQEPSWPPWEDGPRQALVFGDFWRRWRNGEFTGESK